MNLNPTIKSKYVRYEGRILYTDTRVVVGKGFIPYLADIALWIGFLTVITTVENETLNTAGGIILMLLAIAGAVGALFMQIEVGWYLCKKKYLNIKEQPRNFNDRFINFEEYQAVLFEYLFHNVDVGDDLRKLNMLLDRRIELEAKLARGNPQVVKDVVESAQQYNIALKQSVDAIEEINQL